MQNENCFFYDVQEIEENEIYDFNEKDIEVTGDFIGIDDFKEKEKENLKLNEINTKCDYGSEWNEFNLNEKLLIKLKEFYEKPTEIQKQALSHPNRDIIGAAETGSGKTLAYGIPMINYILNNEPRNGIVGLVLVPTRELAIQVVDHLRKISFDDNRKKIVSIVGGMSSEKQERLIQKIPDIIVCTPGRLWALASANSSFQKIIMDSKFLVLDEADRMLEKNHFKHLDEILLLLKNQKKITFVFSATMLKDSIHQNNLKKNKVVHLFDELFKKIEFRKNPAYINLAPKEYTASGILESKIDCIKTEKDLMLYYLLCRYSGKSIVFVNSIDAIRRLVPILSLLTENVYGIHAELQQKQRIRNLERFAASKCSVLIASDVAARGLDIPTVDHVIHYQIPRAADIYIHRSGRTARGSNSGISVMLCAPEEQTLYKKLLFALKKDDGLVDFPIDLSILNLLKKRLFLAKQIDKLVHGNKKKKNESDWFKKAAQDCDIQLSDESADELESFREKQHSAKVKSMKLELKQMLQEQLIPQGKSLSYLTRNPDLMKNIIESKNPLMPTLSQTRATVDLKSTIEKRHLQQKSKSTKRKRV